MKITFYKGNVNIFNIKNKKKRGWWITLFKPHNEIKNGIIINKNITHGWSKVETKISHLVITKSHVTNNIIKIHLLNRVKIIHNISYIHNKFLMWFITSINNSFNYKRIIHNIYNVYKHQFLFTNYLSNHNDQDLSIIICW